MKTMICLILDRSGSMSGRESDVVGGVNTFLAEQKALPDEASIAMVRFDTEIERFRPMQPLSAVADITREEYVPRGSTALLDAVGSTISGLDEDWKRESAERCIVVIVTDGKENASTEYEKEKIKELIEARKKTGLWAFIYLGANVDAFAESGGLGISATDTARYTNTSAGTGALYSAISESVRHMRMTGSVTAQNLGGQINEDGTITKRDDKGKAAGWTPPS